jgi:hypothetical protein
MMQVEKDRNRIREFFNLLEDEHYDLRKFSHPILVYKIEDERVYYSLWEESLLTRYGLKNVDGWDYEDDVLFCPDWIRGLDDDDDDDDDDADVDDEELRSIKRYIDKDDDDDED